MWVREQTKTDGWSIGKYFEQTKNIDLGNYYWDPIGSESSAFEGYYNGLGHSIIGLYLNPKACKPTTIFNQAFSLGFFGCAKDAIIANFVIREGSILYTNEDLGVNTGYCGVICGYAIDTRISNCANHVDMKVNLGVGYYGGIIGLLQVSGANKYSKIEYCYNFGDFEWTQNAFNLTYGGGVAGSLQANETTSAGSTGYITMCFNYNTGDFLAGSPWTFGGIAGICSYTYAVRNNFNVGDNVAEHGNCAALVGQTHQSAYTNFSEYHCNYADFSSGYEKLDITDNLQTNETGFNATRFGLKNTMKNWNNFLGDGFLSVDGKISKWTTDTKSSTASRWNLWYTQENEVINEGYPYLTTEKFASITCYSNGGAVNGMETETSSGHIYGSTQKIYTMPTREGYTFKGWVASHGDGSLDSFGKFHNVMTDGFYDNSFNTTDAYNNSSNGNVRLNLVDKPDDLKLPRSKKVLEISTVGEASPAYGGFHNCFDSKPNGVFYQIIHAKIPEGYTIHAQANAHGNECNDSWLTDNKGTGTWKTYIYKWVCGSTGSFSTIGFFNLSTGPAPTAEKPLVWQVAYLGTFDATGLDVSGSGIGQTTYTFGHLDAELVALWDANDYNIVFDANGGTGTMSAQKHTYGYNKNLTANSFTRNGYIFLGWSRTKQNPISEYDTSKITYTDGASVSNLTTGTGDVTLYAVWLETWAGAGKDVELTTDASGAYLISSAEELGKVSYMSNEGYDFSGKTIRLTKNINLAGKYWMPISETGKFSGTFDGCDKTINGLTTQNFGRYTVWGALFGTIENAKIENVILSNVSIDTGDRGAGIASVCNSSQIRNCQVLSGKIKSNRHSAGIVDHITGNSLVENCVNKAEIVGGYQGGIVALASNSKIKNCINFGLLSQNNDFEMNDYWFGGIVGISAGNNIENCINYGNIQTTVTVGGMGGIVALCNDGSSRIISSANYGFITHVDNEFLNLGGIVGVNWAECELEYCSSIGEISNSSGAIFGGSKTPFIKASYYSMIVGNQERKRAYGNAEDFNEGFRYEKEMNNGLPMQVGLFEYASQIPQQSDVLSVGLAGFEII